MSPMRLVRVYQSQLFLAPEPQNGFTSDGRPLSRRQAAARAFRPWTRHASAGLKWGPWEPEERKCTNFKLDHYRLW